MRPYSTRITVALAAAITLSAATASAASAAVTSGSPRVSPDTSVTSCSSSNAWLKLSGSLRENCYTGNGSIAANLPGVFREQIVGFHTVCLFGSGGHEINCKTGPGTIQFIPGVQVQGITIRTP